MPHQGTRVWPHIIESWQGSSYSTRELNTPPLSNPPSTAYINATTYQTASISMTIITTLSGTLPLLSILMMQLMNFLIVLAMYLTTRHILVNKSIHDLSPLHGKLKIKVTGQSAIIKISYHLKNKKRPLTKQLLLKYIYSNIYGYPYSHPCNYPNSFTTRIQFTVDHLHLIF